MGNKGFGLFLLFLFFQPGPIAIIGRSEADLFFEQNTEGTYAFKPDLIADFDHSLVFSQQVSCFVNSFPCEILMRCGFIDLPEKPVKMKTGQEGPL